MANPAKRLPTNSPGEFFVDATCIDCDTCRWIAPESFDAADDASRVWHQPTDPADRQRATMAAVACPVGAIGTKTKIDLSAAVDAFPERIEEEIYHCGFHAASSYGAASYLIRRAAGNILVDSPRFARQLIDKIEAMGGITLMYLTHRDDVADHQLFRDHFGCDRMIHADDAVGDLRQVERIHDGGETVSLDDDLLVIPVPGHTRGSACLLYRNRYLFTGDHLAWSTEAQALRAFRRVCWYDWRKQTESMARLGDYRFEWILPGHGRRRYFPAPEMARQLKECVTWMGSQ